MAALTFSQLRTELLARGSDYLNQDGAGQTRAKRWLNEAYIEDICDAHPWTFLETTTSGTAPLTITDLREVVYVADTTNKTVLPQAALRDLLPDDPALTATGTPDCWYLDSETSLKVYPPNTTTTISVRYRKVPAELSADSDTPILPTRFHPLIVDAAMIRVYRDSDNSALVEDAQAQFDRRLQAMVWALLHRSSDPQYLPMAEVP